MGHVRILFYFNNWIINVEEPYKITNIMSITVKYKLNCVATRFIIIK